MENKESKSINPNASGVPISVGVGLGTNLSQVQKGGGSNSILQGSRRAEGPSDDVAVGADVRVGSPLDGEGSAPVNPWSPQGPLLGSGSAPSDRGNLWARMDTPHGGRGFAPCGDGNPSARLDPHMVAEV